jgi:hypothetical protein
MTNGVHGLSQRLVTCCAALATCGMAALLVKTPHAFLTYIAMATPFLFLFGVWKSHYDMAATLDATNTGELKTGRGSNSISLNDRATIMATFGVFGIGIALLMGFLLGNMSGR